KTKQYPLEQMAQVINALGERYNIFLLGSPDERNLISLLRQIIDVPVHDLCGKLSVSELIVFLFSIDLVISNDSGPMHIAAALHKPQIAIFGATHPKLGFAPMNDKAIILKADLNCQPCSLHGSETCPLGHLDCLKTKTATEVIKSVEMVSSQIDVKNNSLTHKKRRCFKTL
ncbi:MAG TPA: glycosyltransferase family 9 protein, partial [Candidatus Cloacimonadota bacterium]|nr:glycosyltransferase family 9 protein [Candidatus Cloacimonadota bacterium]